MDAQPTPDELGIENEAICETLLGWKRSSIVGYWFPSPSHVGTLKTPAFDTWADAGLILDALAAQHFRFDVMHASGDWAVDFWGNAEAFKSGPLAIRAAALEYIRSLP